MYVFLSRKNQKIKKEIVFLPRRTVTGKGSPSGIILGLIVYNYYDNIFSSWGRRKAEI